MVVKITTKNTSYAYHSAWSTGRTQLVRSLHPQFYLYSPTGQHQSPAGKIRGEKNTSRLKRKRSSWGRGLRGAHCAGASARSGFGFQLGGGGLGGDEGLDCPGCPLLAQGSGGTLAATREGSALIKDAKARRVSSKMAEGEEGGALQGGRLAPGWGR